MTNILVTGGAGFIGSNFVRYMVDKYSDYHIINLDALTYCGNLENLKDIENKDNYTFVKGDIRDKEVVDDIVRKCDYVINFAAESHVDRSIEDPEIFIKSNVLGTRDIGQDRILYRDNSATAKQSVFSFKSRWGFNHTRLRRDF